MTSFSLNVGRLERLASLAGGVALAIYGLRRSSFAGASVAAAGGALIFRGVTGYCPINAAIGRDSSGTERRHLEIRTTLTVQKPRDEVYAYWRRLENLPRFMKHLDEVRQIGVKRSEWAASIPKTGERIEWEAQIESEQEGRHLSWRSVGEAAIENQGEIRLDDAADGQGTRVRIRIAYRPPAGAAGMAASRLLNPAFEQLVKEDLRRFKQVMEAGEVPTIAGQPTG